MSISLATPGLWLTAVERAALLIGLAIAIGGLGGRGVGRNYKGEFPAALPDPWAYQGSIVGLIASAGLVITALVGPHLAAQLARPAVAGPRAHGTLVFAAIEAACFAIAAVLARRQSSRTVQPLLLVVVAEALRSHPEGMLPLAGALLSICHLLPALLWAGMLLYMLRAAIAWRGDPAAMRGLIQLYSSAAAWLSAVVVVTGAIVALLVVRDLHGLFGTTYGVVLILKIALVALAAGLAIAGRVWLQRQGTDGPARATRLEAATLIAVVVVAGVLTVITPPGKALYGAASVTRTAVPVGHNDQSWRSPSTSTS